MFEIIANPDDYKIEVLKEGLGYGQIAFPDNERKKWGKEIGTFAVKLDGLSEKVKHLQNLFNSEEAIMATPVSLKTFKVQLFKINHALNMALDLAKKLEADIVKK